MYQPIIPNIIKDIGMVIFVKFPILFQLYATKHDTPVMTNNIEKYKKEFFNLLNIFITSYLRQENYISVYYTMEKADFKVLLKSLLELLSLFTC